MTATLARAEVVIQVDVGIGDAAHGCPAVDFPTLLGGSSPRLHAYLKEHSIAEKFHAMVELGGRNSRMKDFFDIHILSETFTFDFQDLASAIGSTFSRRRRPLPTVAPLGLTAEFSLDEMKRQQWAAFLRKARVRSAILPFEEVVASLSVFLMPAVIEAGAPTGRSARWESSMRKWVS
jgi:hypothetical protein